MVSVRISPVVCWNDTVFSANYFATKPTEIATQDATLVLSYSIIMLNTDLHNPQVKRRMTMEDYMKNLRGVNDGKNFAPEYLVAIYEAIRDTEIIMPEERDGTQQGFDFFWRETIRKERLYGQSRVCDSMAFDKDIFDAVADRILMSSTPAGSAARTSGFNNSSINGNKIL